MYWYNEPRCKVSKHIWPDIFSRITQFLLSRNKSMLWITIGILTGHCNIQSKMSNGLTLTSNTGDYVRMRMIIKRSKTFYDTVLLYQGKDFELWGNIRLMNSVWTHLLSITSQKGFTGTAAGVKTTLFEAFLYLFFFSTTTKISECCSYNFNCNWQLLLTNSTLGAILYLIIWQFCLRFLKLLSVLCFFFMNFSNFIDHHCLCAFGCHCVMSIFPINF